MVYVHPVLGVLAVFLMYRATVLGFRARHRKPYAPAARRAHARSGPWIAGLVVLAAALGTATRAGLRPDLAGRRYDPRHLVVGWAVAALLAALWVTGRRVPRAPWAQRLHPLLGLAALALATWGAALGFDLLP